MTAFTDQQAAELFTLMAQHIEQWSTTQPESALTSERLSGESLRFILAAVGEAKTLEVSAPLRLPSTPDEVIAFISPHYDYMQEADDPANVRFQVSVHDLMSSFRDWFDLDEVGGQPVLVTVEFTPSEKLMILSDAERATDEWAEGLSHEPSLTEVNAHLFDLIASKVQQ
jgi:hypothetical protein